MGEEDGIELGSGLLRFPLKKVVGSLQIERLVPPNDGFGLRFSLEALRAEQIDHFPVLRLLVLPDVSEPLKVGVAHVLSELCPQILDNWQSFGKVFFEKEINVN